MIKMPQMKKLSVLTGDILPKFEFSLNDTIVSYNGDQRHLSPSYLAMLVDTDGSQILTSEPESDGAESNSNRPRKRQRLDHLSQEEKIMRRKLKNRVAAQTARDRKKARMVELEEEVDKLKAQSRLLMLKNNELLRKNTVLEKENAQLKLHIGNEIPESKQDKVMDLTKIIKEEKQVDGAKSRLSDESRSLEHASFINVPQLKEQDLQILTLWMMHFVYLPAIARLMIFLIYYSSVVKILCNVTSTVPCVKTEKSESASQILKWWGPHQKAWNPTKN